MASDFRHLPDHRLHGFCLYTLTDPRTNQVRYVGQTSNPKLRKTVYERRWCSHNAGLVALIADLAHDGLVPEFDVIAELSCVNGVVGSNLVTLCENKMIRHYRNYNRYNGYQPLFNVAPVDRAVSRTPRITFAGKTQCVAAWARDLGITRERLRQRLEKYTVEVALTTPKGHKPIIT